MSRRSRKVAKYRRPVNINIGVIIFFVLFVYIGINVILYMKKDHLAIYEVVEKTIADDNTCQGIILREEEVVKTTQAGYVNYYIKDGEKVGKNSVVYSLDQNGNIAESLAQSNESLRLSAKDIASIRSDISNFKNTYTSNDYTSVYDFKFNLENQILDCLNNSNMKSIEDLSSSKKSGTIFDIVKSKKSGIVTYYADGMEDLKEDDVNLDTFNTEEYEKRMLRSNDLVEKDSPVYKIVTNEKWTLILNISKEQFEKLAEKTAVKITFKKDDLTVTAPVTSYQKGDGYFAKLEFNSYMLRYVEDRFVTVELLLNSASGLKIPVSSIIEKEFYKVPRDYFTNGGDSSEIGIVKETYTEKGEKKFTFIPTEIYYQDDDFGYVDTAVVSAGDVISNVDTQETYTISEMDKLEGVYNVNKGYCVFRRIEKVYENQEYCIVKSDTTFGLSEYDHIVLEASMAVESNIIY
ncbi:HlyD family efflux transporter periplasmic adaptor subunit [Anaerosporobacter faecicola]|uniref:HlyD family efflux transporter periplasmic adaptor subunit n=1 Tax=Anaerosporobacter faecicola TaxID=2718714 RepID=UPI00143B149E|nr:HlyD family efflux transporter periplasmic adaptor subunit [Anaerosporobacter faecicola]